MNLPNANSSAKLARDFARAIVRRKWTEVIPLLATNAQSRHSADSLEADFAWSNLGPRLRRQWIAETGEGDEIVPELDPPKRFELFEVHGRQHPEEVDPETPVGWMEVDFQPAKESAFDVCYNCFLALVDEGGPKIAAYVIESAME